VRTPSFPTPWDTHPKRMHRHKTLIQAARIAFGFSGIYDEDEAERILEKDITPQKEEPQATVYYTNDEFTANENAWRKVIENGKAPEQFIAFVQSKGKHFTDEQKEEIALWAKKPTVIEGEASEVQDDFLTEYNESEGK